MTGTLGELKWETLNKRKNDSRLIFIYGILLYKGLKGKSRVPTEDLILPKTGIAEINTIWHFRHPLLVQLNTFKFSFFPQTIKDLTDLHDSMIISAEISDECLSKFTSIVSHICLWF